MERRSVSRARVISRRMSVVEKTFVRKKSCLSLRSGSEARTVLEDKTKSALPKMVSPVSWGHWAMASNCDQSISYSAKDNERSDGERES